MKFRRAWRIPPLGGLAAVLACSTPISFEPQVLDEDEFDAGGPPDAGSLLDASLRDAQSGVREAGGETGTVPPLMSDCDRYEASNCPATQPRNNAQCTADQRSASFCYYRAQAEGQVQVAQCGMDTRWSVSPARCFYRCSADLPQGGNFFSLLTEGCAARPTRDCRAALARTSQEGVDRQLRDFVSACGLPANLRLGVTFNQQGCADWVHYQPAPRLTPAQSQCLTERLEAVRFDCDVNCALTPNTSP